MEPFGFDTSTLGKFWIILCTVCWVSVSILDHRFHLCNKGQLLCQNLSLCQCFFMLFDNGYYHCLLCRGFYWQNIWWVNSFYLGKINIPDSELSADRITRSTNRIHHILPLIYDSSRTKERDPGDAVQHRRPE